MEGIMNFFEQYWGYTLVGGVTLGTVVMFVITAIKTFMANKAKNATIDQLMTMLQTQATNFDNRLAIAQNNTASTEARAQALEVRNEKLDMTVAVLFKAVSFLVVASKLPAEDKTAIVTDFANLAKNTALQVVVAAATPVVTPEQSAATPVEVVQQAVAAAGTLLEKYTQPPTSGV